MIGVASAIVWTSFIMTEMEQLFLKLMLYDNKCKSISLKRIKASKPSMNYT